MEVPEARPGEMVRRVFGGTLHECGMSEDRGTLGGTGEKAAIRGRGGSDVLTLDSQIGRHLPCSVKRRTGYTPHE